MKTVPIVDSNYLLLGHLQVFDHFGDGMTWRQAVRKPLQFVLTADDVPDPYEDVLEYRLFVTKKRLYARMTDDTLKNVLKLNIGKTP